MPLRRLLVLLSAALALVCLGASAASGATATFGSSLQQAPNLGHGCEGRPTIAGDLDTLVPVASGAPSCTWYQLGVFGNAADPRYGNVPGTGRITSVTVRSGPNPAPLRVVVIRQFSQPSSPGATLTGTTCCVFRTQSPVFQPAANAVSTIPLDLPVEKFGDANPNTPVLVDDIVGISAASNTGTLPIFVNGADARSSRLTVPGVVTAAGFWPAMGDQAGDTGGGRSAAAPAGVGFEILASYAWCGTPGRTAINSDPNAGVAGGFTANQAGCGGAGGPGTGPGGGGGGASPVSLTTTLPRQSIAQILRARSIRATCRADVRATCVARATIPAATARALRLRVPRGAKVVTLGTRRAVVAAGAAKALKIPVSSAARTALGRARGAVKITVTTTATAAGRSAKRSSRTLVARP
ncbi:MAG: hypothetical protein AB7V42_11730 [Thermoleophilia bacterium]